jgi:hypothetical protein
MTDSPSTLTFSLKSSDDASIELRPHPWFDWEVLHISSVMSVVVANANQMAADTGDDEVHLDSLRDIVCDLIDSLASAGFTSPMTLVVKTTDMTFAHWHRLAGDQNWLRGTFSILAFESVRYKPAGFNDEADLAAYLSDSIYQNVDEYQLETLTTADYLNGVRERTAVVKDGTPLLRSLVDSTLAGLVFHDDDEVSPPEQRKEIMNSVMHWLNVEVIHPATILASSQPEE